MRTFVLMLAGAGVVLAQGWRRDDDWRYRDRPRDIRAGGSVRHIIRDVEQIAARSDVDRREARRFQRALQALYEFDARLSRGQFDRGRLDRAMNHLGGLAQARQVHPRFRNVLRGHLYQLQRMRADDRYGWDRGRGRYDW
jgi:hypothetical protein